ncbi:hypothetical protein [Dokdonella immobilis]|uniref:hypothetical protein n=1 Tax=Dokdonella immobilis TaxID=578942 RepID=UPI0015872992|nr:hypothetical protein [Dokdonella immobilis]
MLFRNWTKSIAPERAPAKSGEQATRASMADLALPLRCWSGFSRDALPDTVSKSIAPEGAPTKSGEQATRASMAVLALSLRCWKRLQSRCHSGPLAENHRV